MCANNCVGKISPKPPIPVLLVLPVAGRSCATLLALITEIATCNLQVSPSHSLRLCWRHFLFESLPVAEIHAHHSLHFVHSAHTVQPVLAEQAVQCSSTTPLCSASMLILCRATTKPTTFHDLCLFLVLFSETDVVSRATAVQESAADTHFNVV